MVAHVLAKTPIYWRVCRVAIVATLVFVIDLCVICDEGLILLDLFGLVLLVSLGGQVLVRGACVLDVSGTISGNVFAIFL